jgi:chromosome segregation ATPase
MIYGHYVQEIERENKELHASLKELSYKLQDSNEFIKAQEKVISKQQEEIKKQSAEIYDLNDEVYHLNQLTAELKGELFNVPARTEPSESELESALINVIEKALRRNGVGY